MSSYDEEAKQLSDDYDTVIKRMGTVQSTIADIRDSLQAAQAEFERLKRTRDELFEKILAHGARSLTDGHEARDYTEADDAMHDPDFITH